MIPILPDIKRAEEMLSSRRFTGFLTTVCHNTLRTLNGRKLYSGDSDTRLNRILLTLLTLLFLLVWIKNHSYQTTELFV